VTNSVIPLESARRIALNTQLLDGEAVMPEGKEGACQTIEKLGYIQIDTIPVRSSPSRSITSASPFAFQGYEPFVPPGQSEDIGKSDDFILGYCLLLIIDDDEPILAGRDA